MEAPDLISKLHALASHPNTPPHEAAAARAKLRQLLQRHGMTEADLENLHKVKWCIRIQRHELGIFMSVAGMILDTVSVTGSTYSVKGQRTIRVELSSTLAHKVDVTACFGYYAELLATDRLKAKREAKRLRDNAKELLAQADLRIDAMAQFPAIMAHKYNLYPPSLLAEWEREAADLANDPSRRAHTPPPEPPKSEAQREREERERAAMSQAFRLASDADPWTKGAGVEDGLFKLEA